MLAAIRDLTAEIRALRSALGGNNGTPTMADENALAKLLPAIKAAIGVDRTFSVRSLHQVASFDDLESSVSLREALATTGSLHKLGRLLRRAKDVCVAGLRITEIGPSREGMLRTVTNCDDKTNTGH